MIRIAFVIPTLDQSGAERQLMLLASHLPRERYAIRVFALNRGGLYADQLRETGIEVVVLQKRFRFDPLTWIRLRRGLADFEPDIVQSFLFAANSYVRAPGVCPAKAKIIVSERCVDSWKSGWQLRLDRRLAARTDALTANSDSVARFYSEAGVPQNLITVIPNGFVPPTTVVDRAEARRQLNLGDDEQVVGFVGRLAPQKRLDDLIWSFQLLRQTVDRARLVIIGDGPERQRLADLARNLDCRPLIHFAGHRSDAYALSGAFDVFCLPSAFEGMSNSLMEAMSLGIPVVASDIASNQELVTHNETGLLFPVGQPAAMTQSLKRLLDDREYSARLGAAARRRILRDHSVEQLVQLHEHLYGRLLSASAVSV